MASSSSGSPPPRDARTNAVLVEQLLGAALSSVVKAQAMAAREAIDIIDEVGFTADTRGNRRARTFEFRYTRHEVDPATGEVTPRTVTATIPLMTVLNLPSLVIDSAEVDLDIHIVAHQDEPAGGSSARGVMSVGSVGHSSRATGFAPATTLKRLYGTAAGGEVREGSAATLHVSAKLVRDRPLGLLRLDEVLDNAVAEIDAPSAPEELPSEDEEVLTGPVAQGNSMEPGQVLNPDQSIRSADGRYRFVYQEDGNLVLYRKDGRPLWASTTHGRPAGVCIMRHDGNLVLYTPSGEPIWASPTWQYRDSRLVVEDDGDVVIYRPDGQRVWATDTKQA